MLIVYIAGVYVDWLLPSNHCVAYVAKFPLATGGVRVNVHVRGKSYDERGLGGNFIMKGSGAKREVQGIQ